jgi:phosphonate transport system ATP-binding protein
MALKHFPRIVGLRDGAVAFDLPASEVTPARLQALYAQHLDELTAAAPAHWMDVPAAAPVPVAMHCR